MSYEAMDFSGILGMDGFSNELLEDHFKLYQGYVTETNDLTSTQRRGGSITSGSESTTAAMPQAGRPFW